MAQASAPEPRARRAWQTVPATSGVLPMALGLPESGLPGPGSAGDPTRLSLPGAVPS